MCMMSEEPAEWGRPRSLGSGVILLAQQLMGGAETKLEEPLVLAPSQTDVSYRTRPEGISTTPSDSSEVSSLASYRTSGLGLTDDEALNGMLRSHSTLIQVRAILLLPNKRRISGDRDGDGSPRPLPEEKRQRRGERRREFL